MIGIENVNEFYTTHYIEAILEGDLKKTVFKEWSKIDRETDRRPPHKKLKGLSGDFFEFRAALEEEQKLEDRQALHYEFAAHLLNALGYDVQPDVHSVEEGEVPTIAGVRRADGAPLLWAIQAVDPVAGEQEDPLNLPLFFPPQPDETSTNAAPRWRGAVERPQGSETEGDSEQPPLADIISNKIFTRPEPPRFLLVVGESQLLLIDRSKWMEKRLLRFDLEEILGRKETDTLKITAALLGRAQIGGDGEESLIDTLDDSSHKHAFAVSEDLKYALRQAIELVGNEALHHIREEWSARKRRELMDDPEFEQKLTRECLRFMYRLLFLFYIEARPELGYAPMGNDAYRTGYSLETLRDLEMVDLTTDESLNGYFIDESLRRLFKMYFEGAQPEQQQDLTGLQEDRESLHGIFELPRLKSELFDPRHTPILDDVRLRNRVTQQVIELMSLSRPGGRRKRRGRISYAQLGINQLGAVYEALLSYRGFVADEDLYEVKPKKDDYDVLDTGYFVTADELGRYDEDNEIVYDEDGNLVCHEEGSFIYRLAGRDREKSASYYTPEVLTRCLVKYALKELLGDKKKHGADDILSSHGDQHRDNRMLSAPDHNDGSNPGADDIVSSHDDQHRDNRMLSAPKEENESDGLSARDILDLTICEPAMGSAAFLNEAIDQLAEAYLKKRQQELGVEIAHDDYMYEKQRVKTFLADNRVFGVDLNPVAVELGEVSLWLNTIHEDDEESDENFAPWFGGQLKCGNSLIGARREYFTAEDLDPGDNGKKTPWLDRSPTPISEENGADDILSSQSSTDAEYSRERDVREKAGDHRANANSSDAIAEMLSAPKTSSSESRGHQYATQRPAGSVYHFLLPDDRMAYYKDYVIRGRGGKNPIDGLAEDAYEAMKSWRKDFTRPIADDEYDALVRFSDAIDKLFDRLVVEMRDARRRTTDRLDVFGYEHDDAADEHTSLEHKNKVWSGEILSEKVRASGPYRRLKLVMDYWCALWFWPNDEYELLPDRDDFLWDLQLILDVDVLTSGGPKVETDGQANLFAPTMSEKQARARVEELGFVDIDKLVADNERLQLVEELAERYRFHHWELEFADIFHDRGGFDLVLGNPPWRKVEWNEGAVMADHDPYFEIKSLSAARRRELRDEAIEELGIRDEFLTAYEEATATQNFLNSTANYGELHGMKANLYKCFLPRAWKIGSEQGVTAFLHPEGIYDDPKGGEFREEVYPRLRYHFQFINELSLFPEVHHLTTFSINVYRQLGEDVNFSSIANLYQPSTVDQCFQHQGQGPVPGIKDEDFDWNTKGHADRIVDVGCDELDLFAELYDDEGTPALQARLPALHSTQLVQVLRRFSQHPTTLADLEGEYYATQHWNETNAQRDGTIRRDTQFPDSPEQLILSGPHFFVGNPLNKTPRDPCNHNQAYDVLDLTDLPDDYLPRTNYVPDCSPEEYLERTPKVPWGIEKPVTEFYRYVNREMLSQSGERTLISTILPPGVGHIHTCISTIFENPKELIDFFAITVSIPIDFRVKSTGAGHANKSLLSQLPLLAHKPRIKERIRVRALLLTTLTTHYADLWEECFDPAFRDDRWAKNDPRLDDGHFAELTDTWNRDVALRTDFERRQALVEIDVLAAMALGLTLEELLTIYRVQFPVKREYEADTWYDQNGRIVYTVSRGLTGVGLPRVPANKGATTTDGDAWEDVKGMESGTIEQVVQDDTRPGGPHEKRITYEAPFTRCDREADYRTVWKEFERRFGRDPGADHGRDNRMLSAPEDRKRDKRKLSAPEDRKTTEAPGADDIPVVADADPAHDDTPPTDTSSAVPDTGPDADSTEVQPTEETPSSPFLPQANSVERLIEFAESVHAGTNDPEALADALGVSSRTVNYYRKLAEWLGFADSPNRGEVVLTTQGRRFVDQTGERPLLYREALFQHDICPRITDAADGTDDLEDTAFRIVRPLTSLADATARRRCRALASLIGAAIEPDSVRWRSTGADNSTTNGADDIPVVADSQPTHDDTDSTPTSADDLHQVPISALEPDSLITNTLSELGVETVAEMLDFDIDGVRKIAGVGKKKAEALRRLFDRAVAYADESPEQATEPSPEQADESEQPQGLRARLADAGCPPDTPIGDLTAWLPTRICSVADDESIETIGELAALYSEGALTDLSGIGPSTVERFEEFLVELIEQGYDIFRFGPGGRPESVSQLVDAALDVCTDRQRRILLARFVHELILEQLGDELDVTRERIRQIEEETIDEFAERFGDVARQLTAPILDVFDEHVPLIHADGLTPLVDESSPGRLVLALRIAGLDDVYRHDGTLLTTLEATGRSEQLHRLRDALQQAGPTRLDLEDATEAARDIGFYDDRRAIAGLLETVWDIEIIDGSFTLPWVSLTETVTNIVHELGRPVSTDEIQAAYDEHRSEPGVDLKPLRGRDIQSKAMHSDEIYNYDHGVYVHIDNIPMARADFEAAVDWAVDYLEGHTEQVSVESILDEMRLQRVAPAGLSPHLLKSALNRHPDTLSFKNTLLVAHAETWVDSGMTMVDRLEEALMEYDEPVKLRRLCRDLADYSYSIHTLRDTLLKKPWGMPMGRSRFLHAEKSGVPPARRDKLIDEITRQLPDDGSPVAAAALLDELTGDVAAPLRNHDLGCRILWALARGYGENIVAGTGELLAIDTGDTGKSLFRDAVWESLLELGIAYPRDVHDHLRSEYGYDGQRNAVSTWLRRFLEDARVQRLPNSTYYVPGDTREKTFERWAERPDLVRKAARDDAAAELPEEIRATMVKFFTEWDPREELVEALRVGARQQ